MIDTLPQPAAVDASAPALLDRLRATARALLRRPRPAWAADAADPRLASWETWPAWGLLAAAGLNTVVWYVGQAMPAAVVDVLPWVRLGAGIAAVAAIDGSLIATVMGVRAGRRSFWSWANVVIAAAFTGLASWSAQGVLPEAAGHWLHGLFAIVFVAYLLHLAQPRLDELAYLRRLRADVEALAQQAAAGAQANAAHAQLLDEREQDIAAAAQANERAARDVDFRAQAVMLRADALDARAQALDARDAAQTERAQVQADRAQGLKLLEQDLGRQSDALLRRSVELDDRARDLDNREAEPIVRVASLELSWPKLTRIVNIAIDRELRSEAGVRALVTREYGPAAAGKEGA